MWSGLASSILQSCFPHTPVLRTPTGFLMLIAQSVGFRGAGVSEFRASFLWSPNGRWRCWQQAWIQSSFSSFEVGSKAPVGKQPSCRLYCRLALKLPPCLSLWSVTVVRAVTRIKNPGKTVCTSLGLCIRNDCLLLLPCMVDRYIIRVSVASFEPMMRLMAHLGTNFRPSFPFDSSIRYLLKRMSIIFRHLARWRCYHTANTSW